MKPQYSLFSDKGGRLMNEDCAAVFTSRRAQCYVLCDGLGGHGLGDIASRCVTGFIGAAFRRGTLGDDILAKAHRDLCERQSEQGVTGKMRTTAVVLTIDGDRALCTHIGDSRLYHFRGGEVLWHTRDHSIPQMLVLTGEISEDEIRSHPDRNKLLRALGDEREEIKYESKHFSVQDGDAFLLCSDGFWEPVTEREMTAALQASTSAKQWLCRMADLAARNSAGKTMDNYTAIAVMR